MLFGKRSRPALRDAVDAELDISISGSRLELVDHVKNLGLIMHRRLCFDVHVSQLIIALIIIFSDH